MNSSRKTSVIAGILILVAYSMLGSGATSIKWVVALLDLVSGAAVIGLAALMYPFFQGSNRQLSIGYLVLKILEGALMLAAGLLFLSDSLQNGRGWIYNYPQTYVFIASAFLFYILLFQIRLVPRFISVWGLVACLTLLSANVMISLEINFPVVDVLMVPIFTNEIFLALWLIVRGFDKNKTIEQIQNKEGEIQ